MAEPFFKVVYSQDLHALAEALRQECFSPQSPIFQRRLIAVPDMRMKNFLVQFFMSHPDLQIYAGLFIFPLHQMVVEMQECSSKEVAVKPLPTLSELSLQIQQVLLEGSDDPVLQRYLEGMGGYAHKLARFADELATIFMHYGLYAHDLLPAWLQEQGWQQSVWKRVFAHFSYPAQYLSCKTAPSMAARVFLFGFSEMPTAYLRFFAPLSPSCYFFSPCALFWGDILSNFERKRWAALSKRLGASYDTFEPNDVLLGNLGLIGREFIKQLDAFPLQEEERYTTPLSCSLLHQLQRSILFGEERPVFSDDSIQIHSAVSKLEEVEFLKQEICRLIQQEGMGAEDFLILVCDLPSYAPLIQAVFAADPCKLPFQMTDSDLGSEQEPFIQLVTLHTKGFARQEVCAVLRTEPFQKRWDLSAEEVQELERFFEWAKIESDLIAGHSWQEGLDRLLYGLLREDFIGCIAHTQIDVLNRFLSWWELIGEQSRLLRVEKSIPEWIDLFMQMAPQHFLFNEQQEKFLQELERLKERGHFDPQARFSFEGSLCFLKRCFRAKTSFSGFDRVIVSSFDQLHLPAAKVIWCVGVDEELLPQVSARSCLIQLPVSCMSLQDQQRYILLEALMKAGSRLYFSYERMDSQDAKEKKLSRLVEQIHQEIQHHRPLSAKIQPSPLPLFSLDTTHEGEGRCLSLSQLKKCGRSPLQLYMNERWGIVEKMPDDEGNERFALSPLDKALFRKQFQRKEPSLLIAKKQAQGRMPQGAFEAVAIAELSQELAQIHEAFATFGISREQVKSIRFVRGLRHEIQDCYPLLRVVDVEIEGVLEGVTPQGLLYDGECNEKGLMRVWPLYLIYRQVYPDQPYILFVKDQQRVEIPLDCPQEALGAYVQFYRAALQECCPLTSNNIKYFLNHDRKGFEAFLHKDSDPYIALVKRREALGELLALFDKWQPVVAAVFDPVIKALS